MKTARGPPSLSRRASCITPMMAMLRHALAASPSEVARAKRLFFFHGARSDSERPFSAQLKELAARNAALSLHLFDSAADGLAEGVSAGRVTIDALKRVLPFDDYDFYLCGPESFMRDLYEGLRGLNVADERIRFEAFGPGSASTRARVSHGAFHGWGRLSRQAVLNWAQRRGVTILPSRPSVDVRIAERTAHRPQVAKALAEEVALYLEEQARRHANAA